MGWVNPRWNSISDPDLRAIFQSLQDFLADPTFDKGIQVGNGTPPTYNPASDLTTYQNLLRWGSDQLNAAMADTPDGSAPSGSPTPTVQGAIGAMVVTWARVANNNSVVYEVHLGTSSTFTASSTTKVGEVTDGSSFWIRNEPGGATLQWGVTYYVRLVARDSDGAAAASSAVSGVPLQVNADFLATHAIVAGNAIIDTGAISTAMIASLDAGKITTGTLDANRIGANSINASKLAALNLEVGKFIKSNSYTAGTAGWAINADGTAEFNNVIVRGTVYATNGSFSGTLSTNAISGWLTTQTGGGFRSGASGARVEIQGGSWSNEVGFFTGDASETAHGYISCWFSSPNGIMQIAAPQITGQAQMGIYTQKNVNGGRARHEFTGDVYINGTLTMQAGFGVKGGLNIAGTGSGAIGSTGSHNLTTWVGFTPVNVANFDFTKISASTRLLVTISAAAYCGTVNAGSADWGVNINGVVYPVVHIFFNQANTHTYATASVLVAGGLAAGTYTVVPVWKTNGQIIQVNTDDVFTCTVMEVI